MTAPHTAEFLAGMTGVELSEICAELMGYRRQSQSPPYSRADKPQDYWINDAGDWFDISHATAYPHFRPDINHNGSAYLRQWTREKWPGFAWSYDQINTTDGILHEWTFWGDDTASSGFDTSGLRIYKHTDKDECRAVVIVAILAAQALGGGGEW